MHILIYEDVNNNKSKNIPSRNLLISPTFLLLADSVKLEINCFITFLIVDSRLKDQKSCGSGGHTCVCIYIYSLINKNKNASKLT